MDELTYLESLQGSGIRPGLQRVRALLRAAGRPQTRGRFIIVAGTNGKGSTSATLSAILHASGIRTALYTSPHLVRIEERWRIAEEDIETPLLLEAIRRLRAAADRCGFSPTYFEALTVIAFIAFELAGCEVAVLEVGMGGRLDATNVVRPLASVITRVGMDHMEYLGSTLAAIAREKAGVIHRGAVAVTSNDDAVVLHVLRHRARRVGVDLHEMHEEASWERRPLDAGTAMLLRTPEATHELRPPLAGSHQAENVALAVRTAELLRPGVAGLSATSIAEGVAKTRWRGRLERFDVDGKIVVVDGAHNRQGAEAIARHVQQTLPTPRTLVFGVMRDKNPAEVAAPLFPLFDRIVLTEPPDGRAATVAELHEIATRSGRNADREPDAEAAIQSALRDPAAAVLVAGSLYLAGKAIEVLDRIAATQAAARISSESSQDAATSERRLPNDTVTTF
jgi:dihydrofolate synthase / folylpolyglutamate synthase